MTEEERKKLLPGQTIYATVGKNRTKEWKLRCSVIIAETTSGYIFAKVEEIVQEGSGGADHEPGEEIYLLIDEAEISASTTEEPNPRHTGKLSELSVSAVMLLQTLFREQYEAGFDYACDQAGVNCINKKQAMDTICRQMPPYEMRAMLAHRETL